MVVEEHPTWTYGRDRLLQSVGGSPRRVESFLRFVVPRQSGRIEAARLRVRSYSATANGPAVAPTSTVWSETGLTWKNRVSATASALADKGTIAAGTYVDYIVTSKVTAAGTYSFRLAGSSTDGVYFHAREASTTAYRPKLILTIDTDPVPVADVTAPTVTLTSPAGGATVTSAVALAATASDNVGVTRVDFTVDGAVVGTDTVAPFASTFDASSLTTGSHVVAARAYDAAGNASTAATATVQKPAPPDVTAPTLTLAGPTASTTVAGEVGVTATATDNVGVARVVFSVDGVVHSTDVVAPYTLALQTSSLTAGTHTVAAQAYDAAGNASTRAAVSLEVSAPAPAPAPEPVAAPAPSVGSFGGLRTVPAPTWWVSPTGGGTGRSATSPTTLLNAESQVVPGDVVFLLPGEYRISNTMVIRRSGTEDKPIWWTSAGDAWLRWSNNSVNNDFIQIEANAGRHHRGFSKLNFDGETREGRRYGNNAIFVRNGSHHIWMQESFTKRLSGASFASHESDYLEVLYNRFWLGGDLARSDSPGPAGPSWTSFISLNNAPGVLRHDAFPGFHNFIVGNIGAGQVDRSGSSNTGYMTDGNFIILDRGGPAPNTLIMNNLGYMSGGRCITPFLAGNGWIINNTCYKNTLMNDTFSSNIDEYWGNESDNHYINNIGAAWTGQRVFSHNGDTARVTFQRNAYVPNGGAGNIIPGGLELPFNMSPMFQAPLWVPSTGNDLYKTAPDPRGITNEFELAATSPVRDHGIDPRTAIGMTADLRAGLERFAGNDLAGKPRPAAGQGGWSIGAYER